MCLIFDFSLGYCYGIDIYSFHFCSQIIRYFSLRDSFDIFMLPNHYNLIGICLDEVSKILFFHELLSYHFMYTWLLNFESPGLSLVVPDLVITINIDIFSWTVKLCLQTLHLKRRCCWYHRYAYSWWKIEKTLEKFPGFFIFYFDSRILRPTRFKMCSS